MPLHVVPASPPPEKRKRVASKVAKPAELIQCPRCEGREVTPTILGAMLTAGKLKGGTTQFLCTGCLLKGERVVLA